MRCGQLTCVRWLKPPTPASEPEGEEEGGEDEGEGEEVEEEAGEVDDPLSPAAIASRLLSISVRDRPAEPRSRWAPDLALAGVD